MRAAIGIDPDHDHLYDPQQQRPVGFCIRCGAEIYRGNACDLCRDCLDSAEETDDGSDT